MNKKIIKNIALYSVANYLYTSINAISNIFVSNILGPANNGIISYYNAISTNINMVVYGTFRSSIEREVPLIESLEKKREYAQQAFSLCLICAFFFSALFIIIGFFSGDSIMEICAYMAGAMSFVACMADFYRIWNKSLNRISMVSYIMIGAALLVPVTSILFSIWFKIIGFWTGRLLMNALVLISYLFLTHYVFRFVKPDIYFLKRIFKSGGEIVLFGLFSTGISTMDRFFIKSTIGVEQLGFYAVGAMMMTMLMLIPTSMTGAVFPRFVGMVNENKRKTVERYSLFLEYGCVLISIVMYVTTPILIKFFMPKYVDSVPLARILLVAFVLNASVQLRYIDIIRKKEMKFLIKNASVAFIGSIVIYTFIANTCPNTICFAWGTVACFLLLSLSTNLAWSKSYGDTFIKKKDSIIATFIPLLLLLSLIFVANIWKCNIIIALVCCFMLTLTTFVYRYKRLNYA